MNQSADPATPGRNMVNPSEKSLNKKITPHGSVNSRGRITVISATRSGLSFFQLP